MLSHHTSLYVCGGKFCTRSSFILAVPHWYDHLASDVLLLQWKVLKPNYFHVSYTGLFFFFFFYSHNLNHKDLSWILVLSKSICKDTEAVSFVLHTLSESSWCKDKWRKSLDLGVLFITVKNKNLWVNILTVSFVILPNFISPGSNRINPC